MLRITGTKSNSLTFSRESKDNWEWNMYSEELGVKIMLSVFLHLIFNIGFFSSLLEVATSVMKFKGRGKSKEVRYLPEINWSK